MDFVAMDCADLADAALSGIADASYDLVVDKAMIDAITCLPERAAVDATLEASVYGLSRVLRRGGGWVVLSFNGPAILMETLTAGSCGTVDWVYSPLSRLHLYVRREDVKTLLLLLALLLLRLLLPPPPRPSRCPSCSYYYYFYCHYYYSYN